MALERLTTVKLRRETMDVYHDPNERKPKTFTVKLRGVEHDIDVTGFLTQPERDSVISKIVQTRAKASRHV